MNFIKQLFNEQQFHMKNQEAKIYCIFFSFIQNKPSEIDFKWCNYLRVQCILQKTLIDCSFNKIIYPTNSQKVWAELLSLIM